MQRLITGRWTKKELREHRQLNEQLRKQWNALGQSKQEALDDEIDNVVQNFEAEVREALGNAVRRANERMRAIREEWGDQIVISALSSGGVDGDNVCGYRVVAEDGTRAQNVHGWSRGDIHLHWSWRPDKGRIEWPYSADGAVDELSKSPF